MGNPAHIHLSRTQSSKDEDQVHIEIKQNSKLVRVALTVAQFGELVTGNTNQKVEVVRWTDGLP